MEFVNEGLEMGMLCYLVFVFFFGYFFLFFFGGIEGFEVGIMVVVEMYGVLMNDVGCYFVEEGFVVRYDKNGVGVVLKVVGKEGDRWNV